MRCKTSEAELTLLTTLTQGESRTHPAYLFFTFWNSFQMSTVLNMVSPLYERPILNSFSDCDTDFGETSQWSDEHRWNSPGFLNVEYLQPNLPNDGECHFFLHCIYVCSIHSSLWCLRPPKIETENGLKYV